MIQSNCNLLHKISLFSLKFNGVQSLDLQSKNLTIFNLHKTLHSMYIMCTYNMDVMRCDIFFTFHKKYKPKPEQLDVYISKLRKQMSKQIG